MLPCDEPVARTSLVSQADWASVRFVVLHFSANVALICGVHPNHGTLFPRYVRVYPDCFFPKASFLGASPAATALSCPGLDRPSFLLLPPPRPLFSNTPLRTEDDRPGPENRHDHEPLLRADRRAAKSTRPRHPQHHLHQHHQLPIPNIRHARIHNPPHPRTPRRHGLLVRGDAWRIRPDLRLHSLEHQCCYGGHAAPILHTIPHPAARHRPPSREFRARRPVLLGCGAVECGLGTLAL